MIAIFANADNDFQRIVFALLVLIYASMASSAIRYGVVYHSAFVALSKEFCHMRKLLKEEAHISNSSLNAVFPEQEITKMKSEIEKWQKDVDRLFNKMQKKEKEEIKAHDETGEDKSSFEPSKSLLDNIEKYSSALFMRNRAKEDFEKMVNANLAVLNGAPIKEVQESCNLRYQFAWIDRLKDKREQGGLEKRRKEYCNNSWEYILKEENDYVESLSLFLDRVEEFEHEEERAIAEAEKEVRRSWMLAYIEGSFISIIFLIALWHLLRGIHIFL